MTWRFSLRANGRQMLLASEPERQINSLSVNSLNLYSTARRTLAGEVETHELQS